MPNSYGFLILCDLSGVIVIVTVVDQVISNTSAVYLIPTKRKRPLMKAQRTHCLSSRKIKDSGPGLLETPECPRLLAPRLMSTGFMWAE